MRYKGNSQLLLRFVFQGVAGNALEGSVHIDVLLGGGFKVGDAPLGCAPLLCLLLCHLQSGACLRQHGEVSLVGGCNCAAHTCLTAKDVTPAIAEPKQPQQSTGRQAYLYQSYPQLQRPFLRLGSTDTQDR